MQIVATFDPSVTTNDTFTVPQSSANGKMVVYNESNINLQFSFQDGSSAYVPAWMIVIFCGRTGNVNVTWQQQSILSSNSPPMSQVVVEIYAQGEPILGSYPAPLVRQTNIGNTVSTAGGSVAQVINDGNPANTQFVEATVSGDASSAVVLKNDGTFKLGNATHTGSISSDNAKFTTDGSGNVAIGGTLTVTGTSSLDNTAIVTDGSGVITAKATKFTGAASKPKISSDASGNLNVDIPDGTRIFQVNSSGVTLSNGSSGFQGIAGEHVTAFSWFSGNASGTYNHNLGTTPTIVVAMSSASAGSETLGSDSWTSTQVHMTNGASIGWRAFAAQLV